ncbi:MAG: hypothetical protein IJC01_04380 [Clostridia bacterium]|nr:hypothetical protein [Clostridia bacterium]
MIKFGPSGPGERFYELGYKTSEQAAEYVKNLGLQLFEYSFGRGVNIKDEKAASMKTAFENANVKISVHAPYYINFATPDEEKAINSYRYVIDSAIMAKKWGRSVSFFILQAKARKKGVSLLRAQ